MIFSIQPKNFTEHDTFSYGISKTPLFKFQTRSADKQFIFSIQPKNFTEHDTFSYGISKTPLFKFQTLSADKQFLQHRASYSKTVSYNVNTFN